MFYICVSVLILSHAIAVLRYAAESKRLHNVKHVTVKRYDSMIYTVARRIYCKNDG